MLDCTERYNTYGFSFFTFCYRSVCRGIPCKCCVSGIHNLFSVGNKDISSDVYKKFYLCLNHGRQENGYIAGTDHGIDSGIAGTVSDRILKEIAELSGKVDHFVIVSNNVFEDGIDYEESTRNYIRELGHVNAGLAAMADTVVEVVVGIPVFIKQ